MKINRCVWGIFSFCLAAGILAWLVYSLPSTMPASAQDIADVNPVANAGPDRSVIVGAAVILDGSGSYDPDDDLPLSYLWAQTGGPTVTFNPTLSVTTFTAPAEPAVLTFTLAVTDSQGFTDPTPDEVLVLALGQPVANDDSGAGFTTDEDTPFITADVLANDTDSTGSPLALQSFDTSRTQGQVSLAQHAGRLDITGFNPPDGYTIVNFGGQDNYSTDLVIQPDGKSIVAGDAYGPSQLFAMARYNTDGNLDTTFGDGGVVTTAFPSFATVRAAALQPDGKIILAGDTHNSQTNRYSMAMARYHPDGSLDAAFGSEGKVIVDFENGDGYAYGMAVQADGKIILGGCIWVISPWCARTWMAVWMPHSMAMEE